MIDTFRPLSRSFSWLLSLGALALLPTPSQATPTLTTIHAFGATSTEGRTLIGNVTQGSDGNFYGTTYAGGTSGNGTVFQLTPAGTVTTLVNFDSTDAHPIGGLIEGSDGNFYGTTKDGGSIIPGLPLGTGTIFKVTTSGALTLLHQFAGYPSEGSNPCANLVEGSDGNFYGTTSTGGVANVGTIFKVTPSGAFTSLVNLNGTNGANCYATLVLGSDGNFYGTAEYGGSNDNGAIFKVTPSGTLTTIYSFVGDQGYNPYAGLALGSDGNFYGTTNAGGSNSAGTVFKITPSGALTTLANFSGSNGSNPAGSLVEGADGNFYGTTYEGGNSSQGTLFKITPAGALTSLFDFAGTGGAAPGQYPYACLIEGSDGNLYGTASGGGSNNYGTAFEIAMDTPPPAPAITSFSPTSGSVGTTVTITGTNLTGATAVKFDGTAVTTFTVVSATSITTTVPSGAATGSLTVVTAGGQAASTAKFTVKSAPAKPTITSFTPASGPVGTTVTITGTNLTGTTVLGFQGKHAKSFTVNAQGTQITTTVPAGAKTGPIAVLTNGIEVKSKTSYAVTP